MKTKNASRSKSKAIPNQCCTLDIEGEEQEEFLALCAAISNPIRFEVLKFLLTHPGCITGDIVNHLPIAQATVSQHLKVLRESGWVIGVTEGPAVCYCLDQKKVKWFKRKVSAIF